MWIQDLRYVASSSQGSLAAATSSPGNAYKVGPPVDGNAAPEHAGPTPVADGFFGAGCCIPLPLSPVHPPAPIVGVKAHPRLVRKEDFPPLGERPILVTSAKFSSGIPVLYVQLGAGSGSSGQQIPLS